MLKACNYITRDTELKIIHSAVYLQSLKQRNSVSATKFVSSCIINRRMEVNNTSQTYEPS
jgi:hypothetical protein